jgi:presenilin-like A22 family membrane protease
MGLGDVIFPGMLVISALTFLPSDGTFMGLSDPMFVAIGSLIGGLLGYVVLMGYVAMGRPQAGLPLLNGGSIIGYLITGFISIGYGAISFGITIF